MQDNFEPFETPDEPATRKAAFQEAAKKIEEKAKQRQALTVFEKCKAFFRGVTIGDWVKVVIFLFIIANIIANGFSGGGANSAYP